MICIDNVQKVEIRAGLLQHHLLAAFHSPPQVSSFSVSAWQCRCIHSTGSREWESSLTSTHRDDAAAHGLCRVSVRQPLPKLDLELTPLQANDVGNVSPNHPRRHVSDV